MMSPDICEGCGKAKRVGSYLRYILAIATSLGFSLSFGSFYLYGSVMDRDIWLENP